MAGDDGDGPAHLGGEALARVHHDMTGDGSVPESVVDALAEASDLPAEQLRGRLYETVDADALDRLFRPKHDGTPRYGAAVSFSVAGHDVTLAADGTITVRSELTRLKERGGNLLVVGSVPDDVVAAASASLFGDPRPGRRAVVALADRGVATGDDRLARARVAPDAARVVAFRPADGAATTRSAVASAVTVGDLPVRTVTGDLEAFRDAVVEAVYEADRAAGGLGPADLRLCVDSLRPVVAADAGEAFVGPVREAVEDVAGMAHYLLPTSLDANEVRAVQSLFDAVVELRVGTAGPEQRWHLADSGFSTQWFRL